MNYPDSLPAAHKHLLTRIIDKLSADTRLVGIAASGSYVTDTMDEYSDIDLVIAIEPQHYDEVLQQRY